MTSITITDFCQTQIDKLAGMSAIEMLMFVSTDSNDSNADRKLDLLTDINAELQTSYSVNHLNNWLAGRKKTPTGVLSLARQCVFQYLLGDENAAKLAGLF
jgi:hypothetical protein